MKLKCKCGKLATWYYMPEGHDNACCDDCVPRGCTCNFPEDIDEQGRKMPCCEYCYDKEGWEDECR